MNPELAGFARHPSGLLVPDEVRRIREVWTRDEWRVLERATKMLASHGVALFLGCDEPGCQGQPMERLRNLDGGITLRCAHKDRVVPARLT